jgi:hypothetical protein
MKLESLWSSSTSACLHLRFEDHRLYLLSGTGRIGVAVTGSTSVVLGSFGSSNFTIRSRALSSRAAKSLPSMLALTASFGHRAQPRSLPASELTVGFCRWCRSLEGHQVALHLPQVEAGFLLLLSARSLQNLEGRSPDFSSHP